MPECFHSKKHTRYGNVYIMCFHSVILRSIGWIGLSVPSWKTLGMMDLPTHWGVWSCDLKLEVSTKSYSMFEVFDINTFVRYYLEQYRMQYNYEMKFNQRLLNELNGASDEINCQMGMVLEIAWPHRSPSCNNNSFINSGLVIVLFGTEGSIYVL